MTNTGSTPFDPKASEVPPSVLMGADTVSAALDRAGGLGYRSSTAAESGGRLECQSCKTVFDAADYRVDYEHRLEGASDVADSLLLLAGTCPACGVRSTTLLGYGPNATAADSDALMAIDLEPADPLPPGE